MGLLGDSARVWLNAMLDPSNSGSFPDAENYHASCRYYYQKLFFSTGRGASRSPVMTLAQAFQAYQEVFVQEKALGIQVYRYYLPWALKCVNISYIWLFGSRGNTHDFEKNPQLASRRRYQRFQPPFAITWLGCT